ncbi:helix-turn-helix transcriptional regulator, partial [Enterococcus faecalis]|uniref:helix-turn-helix transcriptional regulator n=1 Tax=Enterococcus faecalis TaxID=1351 RepID=UPI003D6A86FE
KKNDRQLQINRLQQNLSSIRKIAGWSAETLGNKIGVTKQTISNLENKKTPMTFTQYIAIRAVLDAEIETNKDNEALPKVISILLDSVDSIDDNEYKDVQKSVATVTATASGGVASSALLGLLGAISPLAVSLIGTATLVNWKKLLK